MTDDDLARLSELRWLGDIKRRALAACEKELAELESDMDDRRREDPISYYLEIVYCWFTGWRT